jgi:hypothetical protein
MSTKKTTKSKAAPKRKGTVPAKGKSAVPAHTAALESRTGHWTQWIQPNGVAFLAQNLMPVHFVIKNAGTESVRLFAEQGVQMDLPAGTVHATYAAGHITVENRSDKWVLIQFEFLPIYKK